MDKGIYHANTNQKGGWMTILISERADFRKGKVIMNTEGHYIIIEGPILKKT